MDKPGKYRPDTAVTRLAAPADNSGMGAWQHLVVSALALLVVFSLALSWMGPMLDHHFAERHPGHQHIYLGVANPEHSHEFQLFHSHNRLGTLLSATGLPLQNAGDGIVFVTPAGGSAHGIADITVPVSAQSVSFGFGDGAGLPGIHHRREAAPPGAIVAPPTLPPRT